MLDCGLRENFVANKVVDYFQLPTVKLSDPYWIPFGEDEYAQVTELSDPYWIPFGEDEYAQVIEVWKVPVSMGKFYKEEITCHVIDMDDTNVLFGRPWHESVNGGYCKDNTYLFRWYAHKIKIKPRRKNIKNDHLEMCEKKHEEATLKIEEKLIKDKEDDSFITSISMSCMLNSVQDQPKEKSMTIPFQVEELKFQDAYSKLVYGIGFMVIPFNFKNIEVDGLSCFVPTNDRVAFKRNSRSSSFQVEETDVRRDFSQFQQRISKRKKRFYIKKNDLNIGNWYSNRLLNDEINHKLLFWIYRDFRAKSWLGFQILICLIFFMVVAPVLDYATNNRWGSEEVLSRGFMLKWLASNCSRRELSGGKCGFDFKTSRFSCLCPDRPHSVSCEGGLVILVLVVVCCFRRKLCDKSTTSFG
ncbi:putative wall-associated receptor kinase [Rosa chinensis]|uniref:Putative wall-associated receptor kinase n=1 Tax=Rosa chinensis TaxID=74649 RepID=A0A2P6R1J7_ROSCH|nr:putative wall-associated receptor kinase [Rosa chinensis]